MTNKPLTAVFTCLWLALLAATPPLTAAESKYHQEQRHADSLYDQGQYEEAMKRYLRLAKKGDAFSQYRVSYMHLEALGEEEEDLIEAFAWATLAAQNRQKELVDYRDAVGSLVPEKYHRKALRRVDYYMRKWGNAAIADDAARGARRELRNCTGSRLGNRCEEVYAMEMPKFWGTTPGHGGGSRSVAPGVEGDGGGAAPSGSVASARTAGSGGAVRDVAYYQQLRARIRALDQYLGEQGGNVELGEFEVLEDEPAPEEDGG